MATESGAKLYVIPGSHPCRATMLMLERKGVPYKVREFMPGAHAPAVRLLRFPGRTVPAMTMDGSRVQTNRRIARFLDEIEPDPPLLPCERQEEIETVERLADEILQPLARRLALAAGRRDLSSLDGHGDTKRLGPILAYSRGRRARIMRFAARRFGISDETEALDLGALPSVLDEVDAWIAVGVLDGQEPNAADFQVGPSLALIGSRLDLREEVEGRPGWRLVERLLPGPR